MKTLRDQDLERLLNAQIEDAAKVADSYAAEVQSGHWFSAAVEIARRIRELKAKI